MRREVNKKKKKRKNVSAILDKISFLSRFLNIS